MKFYKLISSYVIILLLLQPVSINLIRTTSCNDITSTNLVQSGALTLSSPATLTVNTVSNITTDSFISNGVVLAAAIDVKLNKNIQLSSRDNSISANDGSKLTLLEMIYDAASKLKKLGSSTASKLKKLRSSTTSKLKKPESGMLSLTRENTYSGETDISAGTVVAGSSNSLGTGDISADSTALQAGADLTLSQGIAITGISNIDTQSHTITVNNGISGTGKLVKKGSGTLVLTVSNIYSGVTNIAAGILFLKDVSLGGDVTVASGAKLKGTGYLLLNLINNGIVVPGIIKVSGDYTQSPEGILEIFIKPSSSPTPGIDYSQLNVDGIANIEGSNLVVNAEDGSYTDYARYNILTAAGRVNGMFDSYTFNGSNDVYYARLDYDLNNVFLELLRNYLPTHHLDDNRDIIVYINSLNHMSPDFISTINPLYDMAVTDMNSSTRSMSPNRNLVSNYISQDTTHLIHNISNARLDRAQNRMLFSGISDSNNMNFSMDKKMSNTLLSSPTKNNLINQITSNLDHNLLGSYRHSIWFTPFGQFMNVDTNSKNYGYDAKIGGMLVGYDYKINESSIAGLSFGYYQSHFNHLNNQGSNNKIKSTFVNLYGSNQVGKGYINGSLIGSVNKNHLNREIHISNDLYETKSKHNSHVISPRVEIGYNIKENCNYQITSFLATEYTMEFNKGYIERGDSPLNMRIKSSRNDLLTSELGVKLRKAIKLENQEELAIKAKLSYVNKQRSKNRNKIKAGFVDQTTNYQSRNYNTVKHQISPSLGIEIIKENGIKLDLTYSGEISKSYNNHEVMCQIGKEF